MIDWTKVISKAEQEKAAVAQAREQIRYRRDQAISTGTIINGMPIGTDDVTQGRIVGAVMSAMLDPAYSVTWKATDGTFVTLNAEQLIAVAQAIRAHVQACFDREAQLLTALVDGSVYDIDEGWPLGR